MKVIDAEYIMKKHNEGTPFSLAIIKEAQKTLLATTPVQYKCVNCNIVFYTVSNSPEHLKQLCYTCLIKHCCE